VHYGTGFIGCDLGEIAQSGERINDRATESCASRSRGIDNCGEAFRRDNPLGGTALIDELAQLDRFVGFSASLLSEDIGSTTQLVRIDNRSRPQIVSALARRLEDVAALVGTERQVVAQLGDRWTNRCIDVTGRKPVHGKPSTIRTAVEMYSFVGRARVR
jgi:hypothetical protein